MSNGNSKPGWKTTEFWITMAMMVVGVLLESGILAAGSQLAVVAGVVLQLGSALGYKASRTSVKNAEAKAAGMSDKELSIAAAE